MPTYWNDNYIISLYKWRGSGNEYGNGRGWKLFDHVMTVLEQITI